MGWGLNQPTATLNARCQVWEGVRTVKPSCNFHFWCLKSWGNMNLGLYNFFLKFLCSNFFFFKKRGQKFWNHFFQKNFYTIKFFDDKFEFRMFLAFIWYIVHKDEKSWIFKNYQGEKLGVILSYFAAPLRHTYSPYQSLNRLVMIQSFIWDHVWTDMGQKWLIHPPPPPSLDGLKSPPLLGLSFNEIAY